MTPSRPLPDIATLAATLRLAGLALVVELAAWLGAGRVVAALRRRMAADLNRLERYATGLVVLAAIPMLSAPPEQRSGHRPLGAAPGFRSFARDADHMRAMQRKLFPRERNLQRRLLRFEAHLSDIGAVARRLVRHIERVPPAYGLAAIRPPADRLAACMCASAGAAWDTS